jgi:hypothetical protein
MFDEVGEMLPVPEARDVSFESTLACFCAGTGTSHALLGFLKMKMKMKQKITFI